MNLIAVKKNVRCVGFQTHPLGGLRQNSRQA